MSKHKDVEAIIAKINENAVIAADLVATPVKVPIGDCIGKMIECPVCHKPASVTDARGARTATQVLSSTWW
jgi:hypothetical protein